MNLLLSAARGGHFKSDEMGNIEHLRYLIEKQYQDNPTSCGSSFGELLCYEIHENGLTFEWLAKKWGVSLPILGELIYDHCKRLESEPLVDHKFTINKANNTSSGVLGVGVLTQWDVPEQTGY